MTAAALRETVDQFNGFCDQKKDAAFGRLPATMKPLRDGPFYAIPLVAGGSNPKGGLAVNGSRQVLNWSRKPIPGLYAVGEIACGLNQGGAMLTDALIFGIVCGNAVAALKG